MKCHQERKEAKRRREREERERQEYERMEREREKSLPTIPESEVGLSLRKDLQGKHA
jgi:hypothetical protein